MNKSIKNNAQAGFTLIELIVVIVILGILAATALPKFADLGADARAASLRAAEGSLKAAAAMAHGTALVKGVNPVTMEGISVALNANSRYPTATTAFANAAGLADTDYTITADGNTLTVSPKGAASAAGCQIVYATPTALNSAPTYTLTTTNCG